MLAAFKELFGLGSKPELVIRGNRGTTWTASSFGVDGTTFGPDFNPGALFESERYRELDFRSRYAANRQHDHKIFDAQGRFRPSGKRELSQPLIGNSMPTQYVALDQRRPSAPYRLARLVVSRFTAMVFGHGHWPTIKVDGDEDATDFLQALAEEAGLPAAMVRARNKGGGCGTAVISWRFWEGKPRVKVHNAKHVFVHAWADREELVIEHASEIYQEVRDEYDARKKRVERVAYWCRRDWTPNADITFEPVRVENTKAPTWIVDESQTFVHNDGEAHIVWIQNQPPEDDEETADGLPDLDGQWEALDSIDALSTVLNTGTIRNLDPTLVVWDPEGKAAKGIAKGSDNALRFTDPQTKGDAKYLELAGTASTAGISLRDKERQQILEVAACVVADPNEIAAAATSGRAIELLFMPMLSQCNTLRTQYGDRGVVRLLGQMVRSARRFYPSKNDEGEWEYPVEVEQEETDEGANSVEQPVEYFLDLPPRIVEEDELDENGTPTGEKTKRVIDRHPGTGEHIRLEWPPYFPPAPQDQQATMQTLQNATGGKPALSQKTAVELAAVAFGRSASEEQRRIDEELERERLAQTDMFLPGGAEGGGAANDESELTPEDALAITANEYRARRKLGGPLLLPDGTESPDGYLPWVEYKAKLAARGQAAGAVLGQVEGEQEAAELLPAAPVVPPGGVEPPGGEQPPPTAPPAAGTEAAPAG